MSIINSVAIHTHNTSLCTPNYLITHRPSPATSSTRRKQRGFDLIQLGLVVALIGLLMAGAMVGVPKLVENIKSNQQADDVRTFIAQSQAHFALFTPNEVSLLSASTAGLYPGVAVGTPTDLAATYTSRFGSSVDVTFKPVGRELSIKINGIPSTSACTKLSAQLAGLALTMSVGTTEITHTDGRLSMKSVSEACATKSGADGKGALPTDVTITSKV